MISHTPMPAGVHPTRTPYKLRLATGPGPVSCVHARDTCVYIETTSSPPAETSTHVYIVK
eukprot:scaffold33741_cov63-Phaeocystis_antarctica.AAC.4